MSPEPANLLATWNGCGFYRLVGMEVLRADDDGSEFRIEIEDRHLQAYGTAHGGVLAGLIDAAMGLAILARVPGNAAQQILATNPGDRQRLTAERRFVQQSGHVTQRAVDRDHLPGPYDDNLPDRYRADRHLFDGAVPDDVGGSRPREIRSDNSRRARAAAQASSAPPPVIMTATNAPARY